MDNPFEVISQRLSKIEELLLDIKSPIPAIAENAAPNNMKFLSIEETCNIIGCDRVTLSNWTRNGLIEAFRIGRRVLYTHDTINAAMKSIKTKTESK